jgi:hypothetical protein
MEEEPHNFWLALKGCYEKQKTILLLEANHEWTQIRLQDFKSIENYNHVIHKICAKLWFCDKEPSKEDKIEKTLQTMLPLIRSYNINTGPRTTNTTLTSFVTYSRLRSMMNLLLRIITNVVLELLLPLRFTTMRRKQVLLRIQIQRRMIGLLGATAIGRKTESYQSQ